MTLGYRDHIGWNSSKIISLGYLLSTEPDIMGLLQGEHSELLGLNRGGLSKKRLLAYKSSNMSETRQDRTKVTIKVE